MAEKKKNATQKVDLSVDLEAVHKLLSSFIREETRKIGIQRILIGVSGGIDSALSAFLAVNSLGTENVIGYLLPYRSSSESSITDGLMVCDALGIEHNIIDITPMVDSYFELYPDADNLRRGNKMARERMSVLYDQSALRNALVIGTSNKSELLLGYSTLFGDMASALNPLGDLYKTQVFELSRYLGVPESIVSKLPSADLWAGQTDEQELGFSYFDVDEILYLLVDKRFRAKEIIDLGYDEKFVTRVYEMIKNSQFKRTIPIIAKLSHRTIGKDFRYLRDWGK
jgi:NAD+ synthase